MMNNEITVDPKVIEDGYRTTILYQFISMTCQPFQIIFSSSFCIGPNLKDTVYQINLEIKMIYFWVKANKLSLNID